MDSLCAAFSIDRRLMPTVSRYLRPAIFRNSSVSFSCRIVCGPAPQKAGAVGQRSEASQGLLLALPDPGLRALQLGTPPLYIGV